MSSLSENSKLVKLALTAGIAGAFIGYYLCSRRVKRQTIEENDSSSSKTIDLDKIEEKFRFKLVPLLHSVKEKLEGFEPIIPRSFIKLDNKRPLNDAKSRIRVMQWNVLARALYTQVPNGANDERYAPPTNTPAIIFDWNRFRKWRLLEEVLRFDSDIICLEEVDMYEEIKPYLHGLGYSSIFCPKFESTCMLMGENYGPDGCAIFYKLSKFSINNMHCENMYINNTNQAQVFIILQLQHLQSKKILSVVCVHLKSKVQNSERRALQAEYMLKILKRHMFTNQNSIDANRSIILCGDFNGEPFEKFYELIMNDSDIKFDNAYIKCVDSNGKALPSTFKIREPTGLISRTIDYIFYTSSNLNLLQYLKLPDTDTLEALPNIRYSSDHLSLVCDFEII